MSYQDGHIFAPLSTDDVSHVLGESSHDVATLCTSDKINPYSLIRPAYTTNQEFGPESFEKGIAEGPIPEYGEEWFYALKKWGYYVPFVGSPANISLIVDKPWVRNTPDDKSFKCLTHFDGYLHGVIPTLPVSADVTPGRKIVIHLYPGSVQSNIISPTGMANNGGVVAIYEVLGRVKIGCTLYSNSSLIGHYISPDPIGSGSQMIQVDTDEIAVGDTTYRIIPWATDGDLLDNGTPTYGSSFFSLKYAPDFSGELSIRTQNLQVYINDVIVTKTSSSYEFEVTLTNTYDSAQTVNNFRLRVMFPGDLTGVNKKEVVLDGPDSVTLQKQSSETIKLSTSDGEIVNGTVVSMIIVAQWHAPSGSVDIPSQELAGPVHN